MKKNRSEIRWDGEKSRPLSVHRPCKCGCDERSGYRGVGYLTGSTPSGHGFSLWIQDEDIYQCLRVVLSGSHEA